MELLNIIVGIFMIGMGFLVKSAPNLIAGYNTMPQDKKKNVDVEGLSTYMRNSLIIIGLSIIAGYYLFKWIGFTVIANSMILIVTLIGVTIMVIKAQRFDHNKYKSKKTRVTYFILGVVLACVIGLITYGCIPSRAILNDDTIRFTGMYGFEMIVSDIDHIELVDKIPAVNIRTNGYSFGAIHKGTFKLEKLGKCRLLIHSNKSPYLMISKKNGDKIIVNYKDKTETERIYDMIKSVTV